MILIFNFLFQVGQFIHRKGDVDDSLVLQINSLLGELVETCPNIWCRDVARWAVIQLGRWSVEWDGIIVSNDATLEERVARWLDCLPAQVLANLTVSCVAHDADNTVAALLDASVHNGPALNWLVAHVGCSFPATIVNRVLSLGLRSFTAATSLNQATHQLNSIVTILNHLAERHFPEIQRELRSVLLSSLSDNSDDCAKAVVPYLLNLSNTSQSRAVLKALTASLPQVLRSDRRISCIANKLSWWIPKYFPSSEALIDLLVHLLLISSEPATCELIFLLLRGSVLPSSDQGSQFATKLFHYLIGELNIIVYTKFNLSSVPRPLLKCLGTDAKEDSDYDDVMTIADVINWSLEMDNEVGVKRIGQILTFIIVEQGPDAFSAIFQTILQFNCPVNRDTIYLLHTVISAIINHQPSYDRPFKNLSFCIAQNLFPDVKLNSILNAVKKLEALHVGARENSSYITKSLTNALLSNINHLSKLVNVPEIGYSVLELLSHMPLEKPLSLSHLMSLGHAVVYHFFSSLKNVTLEKKLKSANLCNKILLQLSHSTLAHSIFVRLLFEASFRPEWSYLFGARKDVFLEIKESPHHLLLTNHEFDSWVKIPKSHNTIFHSGKISKGQMVRSHEMSLDEENVTLNTQLLLNLLGTCCRAQGPNQGATTLALLLVEYISPDIMFNGFPWPEEFIKFTFERDLAIKKTFEDFPIAWHFLDLVARCRPALCYCSVLVRALTAALTAYWNTCSDSFASQSTDQMKATKKLLEVMVVGQFLPEVFCVLPQMVEKLAPHEVVCILQDIWTYMRDNTPSPDRWILMPSGLHQRQPENLDPRYTDRCRKLIHVHIDIFGHLLSSMIKPQT